MEGIIILQASASLAVSVVLVYLVWAGMYFFSVWRERRQRRARQLRFHPRLSS